MKLKLVIFDLDGTLLDTFGDLCWAVNAALEKNGLPARTLAEVKRFVGNGVRKLVERAVPSGTDFETTEAVYRDFLILYRDGKGRTSVPYDGVADLLRFLRKNGVKIAVLSNKLDSAVKELVSDLLPPVDYAQGETEEIPRKPDPFGAEAILSRFGAKKEETVFVGDSETDEKTAENAGLCFAAVLWGARKRSDFEEGGAAVFFETVSDLKNWFIEIGNLNLDISEP